MRCFWGYVLAIAASTELVAVSALPTKSAKRDVPSAVTLPDGVDPADRLGPSGLDLETYLAEHPDKRPSKGESVNGCVSNHLKLISELGLAISPQTPALEALCHRLHGPPGTMTRIAKRSVDPGQNSASPEVPKLTAAQVDYARVLKLDRNGLDRWLRWLGPYIEQSPGKDAEECKQYFHGLVHIKIAQVKSTDRLRKHAPKALEEICAEIHSQKKYEEPGPTVEKIKAQKKELVAQQEETKQKEPALQHQESVLPEHQAEGVHDIQAQEHHLQGQNSKLHELNQHRETQQGEINLLRTRIEQMEQQLAKQRPVEPSLAHVTDELEDTPEEDARHMPMFGRYWLEHYLKVNEDQIPDMGDNPTTCVKNYLELVRLCHLMSTSVEESSISRLAKAGQTRYDFRRFRSIESLCDDLHKVPYDQRVNVQRRRTAEDYYKKLEQQGEQSAHPAHEQLPTPPQAPHQPSSGDAISHPDGEPHGHPKVPGTSPHEALDLTSSGQSHNSVSRRGLPSTQRPRLNAKPNVEIPPQPPPPIGGPPRELGLVPASDQTLNQQRPAGPPPKIDEPTEPWERAQKLRPALPDTPPSLQRHNHINANGPGRGTNVNAADEGEETLLRHFDEAYQEHLEATAELERAEEEVRKREALVKKAQEALDRASREHRHGRPGLTLGNKDDENILRGQLAKAIQDRKSAQTDVQPAQEDVKRRESAVIRAGKALDSAADAHRRGPSALPSTVHQSHHNNNNNNNNNGNHNPMAFIQTELDSARSHVQQAGHVVVANVQHGVHRLGKTAQHFWIKDVPHHAFSFPGAARPARTSPAIWEEGAGVLP
ncbi:MAG: hypothetical protein M1826_003480 [Phylliscum demangeonii]|nr:MAG: hypothetical protein M1826_003480 [Phylliscum demangeonii]